MFLCCSYLLMSCQTLVQLLKFDKAQKGNMRGVYKSNKTLQIYCESYTYTGKSSETFTGTSADSGIWYFILRNTSLSEHIICIKINL